MIEAALIFFRCRNVLYLEISQKTIKCKERSLRINQISLMHLLGNEMYIQYIAGNMYTDFPWFVFFWLWKFSLFIIPVYSHVFFKIICLHGANRLFGKIVCYPNTINPCNVHNVSWNILYTIAYDKINLTTTVAILNPFNSLGPGDGIYVSVDWVINGSANGLSPVRHWAITWINAELLSTGPLETNFSQILTEIHTF